MNDTLADPLVWLVASRMEEAIAYGADVPELAATTIDATIAEVVSMIEVQAEQMADQRMRAIVLDMAERVLSMQFSGPVPAMTRR